MLGQFNDTAEGGILHRQHFRTGRFLRILSSAVGVDWARHGYTEGTTGHPLSISVPSSSPYISALSLLTDYSGISLLNFTHNVDSRVGLSDVLLFLRIPLLFWCHVVVVVVCMLVCFHGRVHYQVQLQFSIHETRLCSFFFFSGRAVVGCTVAMMINQQPRHPRRAREAVPLFYPRTNAFFVCGRIPHAAMILGFHYS